MYLHVTLLSFNLTSKALTGECRRIRILGDSGTLLRKRFIRPQPPLYGLYFLCPGIINQESFFITTTGRRIWFQQPFKNDVGNPFRSSRINICFSQLELPTGNGRRTGWHYFRRIQSLSETKGCREIRTTFTSERPMERAIRCRQRLD